MHLTFYGATREVTGSCFLLNADNKNILIDCGLAQGADEKVIGQELPFDSNTIDYVLLTHAHIDHSGRLPLLAKNGFRGTIYATPATMNLASIMLLDSAHIHESEAEWKNRKNKRSGRPLIEPLYTTDDANEIMYSFIGIEYGEIGTISENIHFRFVDAGHILGSSSIEIWVKEDGKSEKIVFSGDIGNYDQPIIKDPEYLKNADYVVMESTYGDRLHAKTEGVTSIDDRAKLLADIVNRTFARGGNVVIPSFAVGRTQELLYLFRIAMEKKYIDFAVPVFVDSPLSVKATSIFADAVQGDYFDEEARALVDRGINPISFPSLVTITDVEDSRALNDRKESCVIISSSGMCDAGRIKHHLKHNLWKENSTIVFVGFQAEGTLGRNLVDGAEHVTILGEQIDVRAEITSLPGLSGHADQEGLINWINAFETKPKKVFIVHGDKNVAPYFASLLRKQYGFNTHVPSFLEEIDLLATSLEALDADHYEEQRVDKFELAVALLKQGQDKLNELISRFNSACDAIEDVDSKKAIRLLNAVNRLASDLEDLNNKWNRDV